MLITRGPVHSVHTHNILDTEFDAPVPVEKGKCTLVDWKPEIVGTDHWRWVGSWEQIEYDIFDWYHCA
jgi:hypothetical protein